VLFRSDARRCSGFVRTVIAGSAIAVQFAARKPGANNAVLPTAGTKAVRKADSITGTGSGSTASAGAGRA